MSGPETTTHPYRIVVGVDFETAATGALVEALLTANRKSHGEVHAVAVLPNRSIPPRATDTLEASEALANTANEALRLFMEKETAIRTRIIVHTRFGNPAHEIVGLAAELNADLVLVGTHDRSRVGRILLGSVAETVARTASCPVLLMRPKNHPHDQIIPEIEPPCERCVEAFRMSGGARLFCDRHHMPTVHTYSGGNGSDRAVRPWGFGIGE